MLGPEQLRCPRSPHHGLPSQQHTPELPPASRLTLRATSQSFAVRGTRKAQRFRPRSARPSPSSQDDHTFAQSCQRVLFRAAWLHPVLSPTCRYAPHALPKRPSPCRSLFGARPMTQDETQELTPTVFPFPVRVYITLLHLFYVLCSTLCPAALSHSEYPLPLKDMSEPDTELVASVFVLHFPASE